jgi:hypothetical protein
MQDRAGIHCEISPLAFNLDGKSAGNVEEHPTELLGLIVTAYTSDMRENQQSCAIESRDSRQKQLKQIVVVGHFDQLMRSFKKLEDQGNDLGLLIAFVSAEYPPNKFNEKWIRLGGKLSPGGKPGENETEVTAGPWKLPG